MSTTRTLIGFTDTASGVGRVDAGRLRARMKDTLSLRIDTVVDETRSLVNDAVPDAPVTHAMAAWWEPPDDEDPSLPLPDSLVAVARTLLGCPSAIEVDTVVHLDGPCPPGGGPALKRIGFLEPVDGLDAEAFQDRYRNGHVPLVLSRHPGFHRYATHVPRTPEATPWGAIVEQWFRDANAIREHVETTRRDKPDVAADVATFAKRTRLFVTVESPVIRL